MSDQTEFQEQQPEEEQKDVLEIYLQHLGTVKIIDISEENQ